MRTVGIIVEYNPLHYGHMHHFEQSKAVSGADTVVAVMSGNFLQRGEPAVVNKWARTEMALRMGVDLVIELPVAFSSQPAEWFAYGAVSALQATGVVDSLCFGSESGDISWLERLSEAVYREPAELKRKLHEALKSGASYPAAYAAATAAYAAGAGLQATRQGLEQPNNSLGLHYLIALRRLGSPIRPLTITRQKAGYHQQTITDQRIASATAIRKLLFADGEIAEAAAYFPAFTREVLEREWADGRGPIGWEHFARPLAVQLLNRPPEQLAQIYEVSEGLEHRIARALPSLALDTANSVEQLLEHLKTKRYTRVKLQRMLLRILLSHTKQELSTHTLAAGVPYLRILGFSPAGQALLKRMKRTASVPVITKAAAFSSPLLRMDVRAASVYAAVYAAPGGRELFRDYYEPPLQFSKDGMEPII